MITNEVMNALREDIRREQEERYHRIMAIFMEAYESGNLDKAASLVMTVPEIMSDGLELIYSKLPDEKKFSLPLNGIISHADYDVGYAAHDGLCCR